MPGFATASSLRLRDTKNNLIEFRLSLDGKLQEFVNDRLQNAEVRRLTHRAWDCLIKDDIGEFNLRPEDNKCKAAALNALAALAGVQWTGDQLSPTYELQLVDIAGDLHAFHVSTETRRVQKFINGTLRAANLRKLSFIGSTGTVVDGTGRSGQFRIKPHERLEKALILHELCGRGGVAWLGDAPLCQKRFTPPSWKTRCAWTPSGWTNGWQTSFTTHHRHFEVEDSTGSVELARVQRNLHEAQSRHHELVEELRENAEEMQRSADDEKPRRRAEARLSREEQARNEEHEALQLQALEEGRREKELATEGEVRHLAIDKELQLENDELQQLQSLEEGCNKSVPVLDAASLAQECLEDADQQHQDLEESKLSTAAELQGRWVLQEKPQQQQMEQLKEIVCMKGRIAEFEHSEEQSQEPEAEDLEELDGELVDVAVWYAEDLEELDGELAEEMEELDFEADAEEEEEEEDEEAAMAEEGKSIEQLFAGQWLGVEDDEHDGMGGDIMQHTEGLDLHGSVGWELLAALESQIIDEGAEQETESAAMATHARSAEELIATVMANHTRATVESNTIPSDGWVQAFVSHDGQSESTVMATHSLSSSEPIAGESSPKKLRKMFDDRIDLSAEWLLLSGEQHQVASSSDSGPTALETTDSTDWFVISDAGDFVEAKKISDFEQ